MPDARSNVSLHVVVLWWSDFCQSFIFLQQIRFARQNLCGLSGRFPIGISISTFLGWFGACVVPFVVNFQCQVVPKRFWCFLHICLDICSFFESLRLSIIKLTNIYHTSSCSEISRYLASFIFVIPRKICSGCIEVEASRSEDCCGWAACMLDVVVEQRACWTSWQRSPCVQRCTFVLTCAWASVCALSVWQLSHSTTPRQSSLASIKCPVGLRWMTDACGGISGADFNPAVRGFGIVSSLF